MAHLHNVYDTDDRFFIDPITRSITSASSKVTIRKGDHNSECFAFEIPRYIEGHDMSLCNKVRIHYDNVGKTKTVRDFYEVEDLQVNVDNEETVVFSWVVTGKATTEEGKLNFSVRFECQADDGTVEYSLGTDVCTKMQVGQSLINTQAVIELYPDAFTKLEQEISKQSEAIEKLKNGGTGGSYTLPVATSETLGGVKPVSKTDTMTQEVGVDSEGKLYTKPTTASGGSGTTNYADLENKPQINGVELTGNKTSVDLGIGNPTDEQVTSAVQTYLDEHPEATTILQDGSVTYSKLSGVEVVEKRDKIEFADSYIDGTTGEILSATGFHVTEKYPVTANQKFWMYGSRYNYNSKVMCAYYDANDTFVSSFKGSTQPWICTTVPDDANIAYARFTINDEYKDTFFVKYPIKESFVTCNDTDLKKAIMSMIDKVPDSSVDMSALSFVQKKRYNKVGEKVNTIPYGLQTTIQVKDAVGSFICDLQPNVRYKTKSNFIGNGGFLVFLDENNNLISATASNWNGTEAFATYEIETVNYINYYTFTIPENTRTTLLSYNSNVAGDSLSAIIAEESEFDVDKDKDYYEWVIDEDFAEIIKNASVNKTYFDLNGKVWIGLGDSYTVQADSRFKKLASKYGLVYDGQGKVSSTICGDSAGNKGFSPFWSRMNGFIANYTGDGQTIDEVVYTADDVKLITFMGGANDGFGNTTWLGSHTSMDTNYIYGACNYIFKKLRENFPNAEIVCILQPANYSDKMAYDTEEDAKLLGFESLVELQTWDIYSFGQYKMETKERAVKECAERFGIHIVDCIFDWYSVVNPTHRSTYWSNDTIHLSGAGTEMLTKKLESKLDEIFG